MAMAHPLGDGAREYASMQTWMLPAGLGAYELAPNLPLRCCALLYQATWTNSLAYLPIRACHKPCCARWCTDERKITSSVRRAARRRPRNTILAAQPDAHAKQLLNIAGADHVARNGRTPRASIGRRNLWAVTNIEQAAAVQRELRGVPASHILAEPVGVIPRPPLVLQRFISRTSMVTR